LRADARRSPESLARVRDERLQRVLDHARATVPAYRERLAAAGVGEKRIGAGEGLEAIPPLEREELQEAPERFLSRPADPTRRRVLRWVRTSGSSGRPVTVALETGEWVQSLVTILHGFATSGWRPWRPLAYVCVPTYRRPRRPLSRLGLFREELVDLREGADANLERLRAIDPGAIYGYPSQLSLIAERRLAGTAGPRPRVVLTNGEVLTDATRRMLQRAFGCPVRDTYGCAEVHRIADECREGRLHVVSSAAVVETDPATRDADGSEEVLVTSLYQLAMPLIRYRLGDRVVPSPTRCRCGSPHPMLGTVLGRADDVLRLPSGARLSARSVSRLEEIPGVREFQIVQRAVDAIELRVQPGPGFGAEQARWAEHLVREVVADEPVSVRVCPVDTIERTGRGKRRAVVSWVT
jgi:phenylacetate-CoA ligase